MGKWLLYYFLIKRINMILAELYAIDVKGFNENLVLSFRFLRTVI